jgi:uncharacterized protein YbaA (DUF1428 family)
MTTAQSTTTGAGYVDLYLLPVAAADLDAYQRQATAFGDVAREHGALRYREFRADDLGAGLSDGVPEGRVLTAAVAEFPSREHRDEVMAKVMADPRVTALLDADQVGDMDRMSYGGFETFVGA